MSESKEIIHPNKNNEALRYHFQEGLRPEEDLQPEDGLQHIEAKEGNSFQENPYHTHNQQASATSDDNSSSSQSHNSTITAHLALPLTDNEIKELLQHRKLNDASYFLALWCIRQLQIFEEQLNTPSKS
jgi:hypothetical protein